MHSCPSYSLCCFRNMSLSTVDLAVCQYAPQQFFFLSLLCQSPSSVVTFYALDSSKQIDTVDYVWNIIIQSQCTITLTFTSLENNLVLNVHSILLQESSVQLHSACFAVLITVLKLLQIITNKLLNSIFKSNM